jgi:transcriptional regulator with PAS, ATPase and Fis domain
MNILLAWIGGSDLKASQSESQTDHGPIGEVVLKRNFDEVVLLCNYEKSKSDAYAEWLNQLTTIPTAIESFDLSSPMDFGGIYISVTKTVDKILARTGNTARLSFHISPGTSAMAAIWILLSKTRYPAELIQSSPEAGVSTVTMPFDISAEYIPNLLRHADEKLESLALGIGSDAEGFGSVLFQSKSMTKVVSLAKRVALHRVPVLIEGESGTGKEVFAKAIHQSSPRRDKPFITVNCGAIPEQLVESELFGHKKGSFSGADKDRSGHFAEADGGSIFLDEIGELPLAAQVKLLRVLQESEVTPVGSSQSRRIDVRVISATNRNLIEEVSNGRFREDLFYRLAVFVLSLPPLREREGDLSLLINAKLQKINKENASAIWTDNKELYPAARNLLLKHSWPGNVRELEHTLLRAAVISNGSKITVPDVEQALLSVAKRSDVLLNRPLGNGFDIQELLAEVSRNYLKQALHEANNNKSEAAKLVGLPSYQTFTNWMIKYGISTGT